jgi:hypothetical protein
MISTEIQICRIDRKFTLEEANAMLPILRRISAKHDAAINRALADQRYLMKCKAPLEKIQECDNRVVKELQTWGGKVLKLGVKQIQGGWYAFDTGYGWFSWCPAEATVSYYYDYNQSPAYRRQFGIINK